jgi:nucleoside-diphosphate-sugar epimerase
MKRVCVTGATGFFATHLVKALLERGYVVHGTVRSLTDSNKLAPLLALPHAAQRLKLFKADLLEKTSFHQSVDGCHTVFHTASPFFNTGVKDAKDAELRLLTPAVEGTRNVLDSCVHAEVDSVVLTSSIAAVMFGNSRSADVAVGCLTESDWSDEKYMRDNSLWYPLSKTVAERTAWEYSRRGLLQLRVINPSVILGSLLTPHLNQSHEFLACYLRGDRQVISNAVTSIVDVRDVAHAHIRAAECEAAANQRYLCTSASLHWCEIVEMTRRVVQQPYASRLPTRVKGEGDHGFVRATLTPVSTEKIKQDLQMTFTDPAATIAESVESLRAFKHV